MTSVWDTDELEKNESRCRLYSIRYKHCLLAVWSPVIFVVKKAWGLMLENWMIKLHLTIVSNLLKNYLIERKLFRYSAIRETYQGKLEERLPLMAIILPEILKQNRPEVIEALRNNARLLTTPFDIHATILDALELRELSNNYSVPGSNLPRGLSLLEPVSSARLVLGSYTFHWFPLYFKDWFLRNCKWMYTFIK